MVVGGRTVLYGRREVAGDIDRPVQQRAGRLVSGKQRLDGGTQSWIARTGLIEEGGSLGRRWPGQCFVKQRFFIHDGDPAQPTVVSTLPCDESASAAPRI